MRYTVQESIDIYIPSSCPDKCLILTFVVNKLPVSGLHVRGVFKKKSHIYPCLPNDYLSNVIHTYYVGLK